MPEPTPADLPPDLSDALLDDLSDVPDTLPGAAPADDEPEVVLHSADGDDGEAPWCIGNMTAY
ncbi:hypothetical protein ACFVXQ_31330 [Kitasatospora sp. NPDC058263]